MAGERSPTYRDSGVPKADDLKLIDGIGPAVEKQLNAVGIYTFAQLAVLSPADIAAAVADLAGLSSERVIKQDWIGQAHELAAAAYEAQEDVEASVEPIEDVVLSAERYHPATFTVEFLLDEHNSVHSIHVMHVQSKQERVWMGWQETQLVDFLSECAELNVPSDKLDLPNIEEPEGAAEPAVGEFAVAGEPVETGELAIAEEVVIVEEPVAGKDARGEGEPVTTEEPMVAEGLAIPESIDNTSAVVSESKPPVPSAAQPRLAGNLRVSKMEVMGVQSSGIHEPLTRETPFNVRLTVDLTKLLVPDNAVLNYKVSINGKGRVGRSSLAVGEALGTIVAANTVTLNVVCSPLPEGFYRLVATVMVALLGMELNIKSGTTAVVADTVQVY
jgi:hypothetical protein